MNVKELIKECELQTTCDRCRGKRECGQFSEAIRNIVKPKEWKDMIKEMRNIGRGNG